MLICPRLSDKCLNARCRHNKPHVMDYDCDNTGCNETDALKIAGKCIPYVKPPPDAPPIKLEIIEV